MQRGKIRAEEEKGRIIFVALADQCREAMSEIVREMNIGLLCIGQISELPETMLDSRDVLGLIVSQEALKLNPERSLSKIKNIASDLPIIVAASMTDWELEKVVRRVGIFYYLLEPYEREEFLSAIRALSVNRERKRVPKIKSSSG
jgi:DNA-binding NtrC family response regulator